MWLPTNPPSYIRIPCSRVDTDVAAIAPIILTLTGQRSISDPIYLGRGGGQRDNNPHLREPQPKMMQVVDMQQSRHTPSDTLWRTTSLHVNLDRCNRGRGGFDKVERSHRPDNEKPKQGSSSKTRVGTPAKYHGWGQTAVKAREPRPSPLTVNITNPRGPTAAFSGNSPSLWL